MNENKNQSSEPIIPPEVQEQAIALIDQGLELFRDQLSQLGADLAEIRRRREEIREGRQHGARRTSGRIV